MKNVILDELQDTFFGKVTYLGESKEFYLYDLLYTDGKTRDDIQVDKADGQLWWKPSESEDNWKADFKVKVS